MSSYMRIEAFGKHIDLGCNAESGRVSLLHQHTQGESKYRWSCEHCMNYRNDQARAIRAWRKESRKVA